MRTIKSTLDGVVNGNVSKDQADFRATHLDPSAQHEAPAAMRAAPAATSCERPDMLADRFEDPAEIRETLPGSQKHSAIAPTILEGSKRHSAIAPPILEGSKRHSATAPTILEGSKVPPGVDSKILGGSKAPPEVDSTIFPDLENAAVSHRTGLSHPQKASALDPAIPSNPEKASAIVSTVFSNPRKTSAIDPAVPAPSPRPSADVFESAYQSLLPDMRALRHSQVMPIHVGIPGAITKALQIQPTVAKLINRIVEAAPEVDPHLPERLITHALALGHAHTLFVTVSEGVDELPSLSKEGRKLRAVLLTGAQVLIQRGLIEAGAVRRLRANRGYHTLAFDLRILAELLRPWPASNVHLSLVSAAELERAMQLAAAILNILGRRGRLDADIADAADLRRRAFTLFARVYNETRRAVVFIRWQQCDADQLVPSLYTKRKDRRKNDTKNTTRDVQ
jgi:hypothetical protein